MLGAGIAAGGAFFKNPVPAASEISVDFAQTAPTARVDDPDGLLDAGDQDRLLGEAARLEMPEVVHELRFMVFEQNEYEVIGTVVDHLRGGEPGLIDGDRFADGVLIVGVGLSPRQSFVFAGDDVADRLGLNAGDAHLDAALEAIKPDVRAGDLTGGLLAGLGEVVDPDAIAQARHDAAAEERLRATGVSGAVGLVLAGGSVGLIGTRRHIRGRRLTRTRAELDVITDEYAPLAERLDRVDAQVGALASALADETMHRQWAEVRDRFHDVGPEIDRFVGLEAATDPDGEDGRGEAPADEAPHDRPGQPAGAEEGVARRAAPAAGRRRAFHDARGEIAQAARTVRDLGRAAESIGRIDLMERGDTTTRLEELDDLRDSVVAAQLAAPNATHDSAPEEETAVHRELVGIRKRTARLRGTVTRQADAQGPADAPSQVSVELDSAFLRAYVALLGDYRAALDRLREAKSPGSKATPPHSPALFEEGYRPGYPAVGFVPFEAMKKAYSWRAPGDSTNTGESGGSFSDSGFSGAGGSSHF
ncbi:hypothetical protein QP119_03985 [Corynebacterium frankenforstense]|uniref:hypothetical protein n=1 Tax=Corynebacterium frankenforstense TaxID=1230998 RepID=UPI002549F852|nr:hypothetical protein [Corynebacterium frankenforstense]MDK6259586.1 hypothetical protein [Corynebacterium frankenforstense]